MISINVVDAKEEWLTVQNHPKDSSKGTKQVRVGPKILIEKEDAERLIEGQNATFINWGNLMIQKINKQADNIVDVEARLNLEDKNYKNTLKITWLAESLSKSDSNPIRCYAVYFGHIMSVPVLGKDDDFKNFVAKDTRVKKFYLHVNWQLYCILIEHKNSYFRKRLKCWVKWN